LDLALIYGSVEKVLELDLPRVIFRRQRDIAYHAPQEKRSIC